MQAPAIICEKLLVRIATSYLSVVLGDTTLDTLSSIGARIFVAVPRAVDVLVVIDRGEGEPRCDTNVEVKVTHEFVVAPIIVVPLQVTEVICAVAIYPF